MKKILFILLIFTMFNPSDSFARKTRSDKDGRHVSHKHNSDNSNGSTAGKVFLIVLGVVVVLAGVSAFNNKK